MPTRSIAAHAAVVGIGLVATLALIAAPSWAAGGMLGYIEQELIQAK